jgi:hypothetical protein
MKKKTRIAKIAEIARTARRTKMRRTARPARIAPMAVLTNAKRRKINTQKRASTRHMGHRQ